MPALSFDEIALVMNMRPTQVRGLYRTAIKKLKQRPEVLRHMRGLAAGLHHSPYIETNEDLD